MRGHGPQQIVKVDDARDFAAEGIELGRRARLTARLLGLGPRARGKCARPHRHEHEQHEGHGIGRVGDREFVERRQEEEVEGEHAQGRDPE